MVDVSSDFCDNVVVLDFNVCSYLGNVFKYVVYYKIKNFFWCFVKVVVYLYSDLKGVVWMWVEFEVLVFMGMFWIYELVLGEEWVIEEEVVDVDGSWVVLVVEFYDKSCFIDVFLVDDVVFVVVLM